MESLTLITFIVSKKIATLKFFFHAAQSTDRPAQHWSLYRLNISMRVIKATTRIVCKINVKWNWRQQSLPSPSTKSATWTEAKNFQSEWKDCSAWKDASSQELWGDRIFMLVLSLCFGFVVQTEIASRRRIRPNGLQLWSFHTAKCHWKKNCNGWLKKAMFPAELTLPPILLSGK